MSDSRSNNTTEQLFTEPGTEITEISDAERDLFLEQIAAAFASQEDVPFTQEFVYREQTASNLAITEPDLPLFIEIGLGVNSRRTFMLVGGTDGLYVHVCKEHEDLATTVSYYNGAVPAYDPIYYDRELNAMFFNPNDYETIRNYKPTFILVDEGIYDLKSKQHHALQDHYNDQTYVKKLEEYCKNKKAELVEISMSPSIHSFFQAPQSRINTQMNSTFVNDDEAQTMSTVEITNPPSLNINIEEKGPSLLIEVGGRKVRSFVLIGKFYVHVCAPNEEPSMIARGYNSTYQLKKNNFITDGRFERTIFLHKQQYPALKSGKIIRDNSETNEEYARKKALGDLFKNAEYCKKLETFKPQPIELSYTKKTPKPTLKRPTDQTEDAKIMAYNIIRRFENEERERTLKRQR